MGPPTGIAAALACGRRGCPCAKGKTAHCPVHDDGTPSLSVTERGGKLLVHCQAGCPQEAVIAALKERGLWPGQRPQGRAAPPAKELGRDLGEAPPGARKKVVTTYGYHDESGRLLFQVVRYEPKDFKQRRPNGKGGWVWDLAGARRVLYRLPELLNADPQAWVFVTEGEKDADRLASLDLVTTTNAGGAGKWADSFGPYFTARRVVVLADNDEAGRAHAQDVAQKLSPHASEVKVLELPGLAEKGDISDWLGQGHTKEELLALVGGTPGWQPPPLPDLGALLDDVWGFIQRYVVMGNAELDALTLWTVHTHAFAAAETTPYVHVTSPEKRSGKTRLLEVLALLVARPWLTGRVTAAVLTRKISRDTPTLLLDESDAAFKGERECVEALRSILNAGHRRGGVASLCVKAGGDFELRDFPVFGPKAIAGIGKLPDTVADRAIRIGLKRRAPGEPVARFRHREAEALASPLWERLEKWAAGDELPLADARPEIPEELDDRAADGWEALFAIADAAAGLWPERARQAALALSLGDGREDDSLGVRLLRDIKGIFGERGTDRLSSAELVEALAGMEEAPWGDLRGRPLDARNLARLLRPFGVKPKVIRLGEDTPRGYLAGDFADAWERYVPLVQAQQAQQAQQTPGSKLGNVADVADVAGNPGVQETRILDPWEVGR